MSGMRPVPNRECVRQAVLDAGLAIEQRAGFDAVAERWW